jgi:hypothetical protein
MQNRDFRRLTWPKSFSARLVKRSGIARICQGQSTSQAVFRPLQWHKQHVSTRIFFCLAYRTTLWCSVWMKMKGKKHKQKTICNLPQPFTATSQSELNSPCPQLGVPGTCNIWNTRSDTIHNWIQHKSNILYNNLYRKSVLCEHTHCNSMQCSNFFIIKPTRCTNFTNLFCRETLHVSDSSSVHHQEFMHCTLSNGICHTGL